MAANRKNRSKQDLESITNTSGGFNLSPQDQMYIRQKHARIKFGMHRRYGSEISNDPAKRSYMDYLRNEDIIQAVILKHNGASERGIFSQTGISQAECRNSLTDKIDNLLNIATSSEKRVLRVMAKKLEDFGPVNLKKYRLTSWEDADSMAERVYEILTRYHSNLVHMDRKAVLEGLLEIPEKDLVRYFRDMGLGGAMAHGFNGNGLHSPTAILSAFDYHYRKVSKDHFSLFDDSHKDYSLLLPLIENPAKALKKKKNADKAIYEKLVRMNPNIIELKSADRQRVIDGLDKLPSQLVVAIRDWGFRKILKYTYLKDLPLGIAVLTGYSNHYRRLSEDSYSIFDKRQQTYSRRLYPEPRKRDAATIESMIYKTTVKSFSSIPELASLSRNDVINGLYKMPSTFIGIKKIAPYLTALLNEYGAAAKSDFFKAFNNEFMRRSKSKYGLFDESRPTFSTRLNPSSGLKNRQYLLNLEKEIYETLTSFHSTAIPGLSSTDRKKVLKGIDKLPRPLSEHFSNIHLCPLIEKYGAGSLTKAFFAAFDAEYRRRSKDHSLFDSRESHYLTAYRTGTVSTFLLAA